MTGPALTLPLPTAGQRVWVAVTALRTVTLKSVSLTALGLIGLSGEAVPRRVVGVEGHDHGHATIQNRPTAERNVTEIRATSGTVTLMTVPQCRRGPINSFVHPGTSPVSRVR